MVIISTNPAMKYSMAVCSPPKINQMIFPNSFMFVLFQSLSVRRRNEGESSCLGKRQSRAANEINDCYLCQQNQRESILELLVLSLMPPYLHAKQSSDAATDECQYQQGSFGYAPAALLGLLASRW